MKRVLLILVVCGLTGCPAGPVIDLVDAGPSDAELHHARADQAFQTFLLDYWNGYYLSAESPHTLKLPGYWIFAQAWDVVIDNVERTGRYRGWLDTFYDSAGAHGWSRDYYDDENWMVLALMRAYDLNHEPKYLARAVDIFKDIETTATDTTCCGSMPGGLWWDRAKTQKATAINGGAVLSAVRLSERTGDAHYLDFAKAVYGFWKTRMTDPATHQIGDHFDPQGNVVYWAFTYNEGVMIGGALELYRVTHDEQYLADAHGYAGFMVAHETVSSSLGPVLHDGESGCDGDCPQFKGIGYRYLLMLQKVSPKPEYLEVLRASADAAWTVAKSPGGAHFGTDWAAAAPTTFIVEADASASMALSGYASLLGPGLSTPLPGVYEAEEASVNGLKVAAAGRGFQGWGYLSEWTINDQKATFAVQVEAAGNYVLELRYAAGDGDASRSVGVNGQVVTADLLLPRTAGWNAFLDASLTVALPAGPSKVTVAYDLASHGALNLDRLTLRAAP